MLKHFTILENAADADSPMIGTIDNITSNKFGITLFKERVMEALSEHFDSGNIHFKSEFPDMFCGSPYEDMSIDVDGVEYSIRILETWHY